MMPAQGPTLRGLGWLGEMRVRVLKGGFNVWRTKLGFDASDPGHQLIIRTHSLGLPSLGKSLCTSQSSVAVSSMSGSSLSSGTTGPAVGD